MGGPKAHRAPRSSLPLRFLRFFVRSTHFCQLGRSQSSSGQSEVKFAPDKVSINYALINKSICSQSQTTSELVSKSLTDIIDINNLTEKFKKGVPFFKNMDTFTDAKYILEAQHAFYRKTIQSSERNLVHLIGSLVKFY